MLAKLIVAKEFTITECLHQTDVKQLCLISDGEKYNIWSAFKKSSLQ